jgi:molecular chaperone DnaJ
MPKDYYFVLGVPRGASSGKIKNAYRSMAKRYHPDSCGPEPNVEKFREVQRAYDTLGHEARRKAYDHDLHRRGRGIPIRQAAHIREPAAQPAGRRRWDFFLDAFFDGEVMGIRPMHTSGPPAADLAIEMILEPAEALRGGLFPLSVPVWVPCQNCQATGVQFPFVCPHCTGRARVCRERQFYVSIPPKVSDHLEITLPLEDIGLRGVDLHLFIRIAASPSL